jgi:hypothetical protein
MLGGSAAAWNHCFVVDRFGKRVCEGASSQDRQEQLRAEKIFYKILSFRRFLVEVLDVFRCQDSFLPIA